MLVRDDERAILAIYEKYRKRDESRHNRTKQRKFERKFESRDLPESRAANADASDNWSLASLIVDTMDFPWRCKRRDQIIRSLCASLPRIPRIARKMLWAVYLNGKNRDASMARLKISRSTYWRGLKFLRNFVSDQWNRGPKAHRTGWKSGLAT